MISVDNVISELKALYDYPLVHFRLPEYVQFHNDIREFVYENHFEHTEEWQIISRNLVYKSTQHLIRQEADIILIQLEILKRKMLSRENMSLWPYIHPRIERVVRDKFNHGFYADAVESAFKEVNHRVKQIYANQRGEEKDGQDLMRSTFSPKDPVLTFEALVSTSAKTSKKDICRFLLALCKELETRRLMKTKRFRKPVPLSAWFLQVCSWIKLMKRFPTRVLLSRLMPLVSLTNNDVHVTGTLQTDNAEISIG